MNSTATAVRNWSIGVAAGTALLAGVLLPVATPTVTGLVPVTRSGTVVEVPAADLNVTGVCGVVCPVQWDPSQDADDFSGWVGTVPTSLLSRALGMKL